MPNWRRFEMHLVRLPRSLALDKAGNSKAARMAIIAMTTSSSISVNAEEFPVLNFCLRLTTAIPFYGRDLTASGNNLHLKKSKFASFAAGLLACAADERIFQRLGETNHAPESFSGGRAHRGDSGAWGAHHRFLR